MKLPPKGLYEKFLSNIELPPMANVSVHFEAPKIDDVEKAVSEAVSGYEKLPLLKGKTVALAVGSRGIANLVTIVKTVIRELKQAGADVFIVPAMGSHGGATSEGQAKMLEHLGVCEATVGVPVRSEIEPVVIGQTEDGIPVYFDANAASADYTVSIARIKPHTTFHGEYESGMVKMNVIGLGKQKGADLCHFMGMHNMPVNLPKIGRVSLKNSNLLFSVCLIENALDETCFVKAVDKEKILEEEPALLKKAKSLMPFIPFRDLDVLIIDEMGKNISGPGMDPNIIERSANEYMQMDPFFKRLVVLDLTEESGGNASGSGLADIITERYFDKIDADKAYTNLLTARVPVSGKIPIVMENDRVAIKAGIKSAPDVHYDKIRMVRIRNTLKLSHMEVSEALLEEARRNPLTEVCGEPAEMVFDETGNIERSAFLYS